MVNRIEKYSNVTDLKKTSIAVSFFKDTHLAASEYSEEKAKLLRDIGELIENKNRELE